MNVHTVMTPDPVVCSPDTRLTEVARIMRDRHIGDVLVGDHDGPIGILTDRDIVVRALAQQPDISALTAADVCSKDLFTVDPEASLEAVTELMERHSLRRIPVVDHGRPVGIVSLGDLAEHLDPRSLLGEISASPPDRRH